MSQRCAHGHDHSKDSHEAPHPEASAHGAGIHVHGVSERLGVAFALNLIFACIELIGGILTNSVAVISDAIHDFGDTMALGLAWYLEKKSLLPGDEDYSYGYRRLSTLSALMTSSFLLAGSITVLAFAFPRLLNPQPVHTVGMMGLAVLGILINGYAAYRISRGTSLNEKALTWHLVEDVMGWVLVLVGGSVIYYTGWLWLDAGLAMALAAWIIFNVSRNLFETIKVFLQRTPSNLSLDKVLKATKGIAGVIDIHHPHLWSLDGEKHIFTAHILVKATSNLEEIAGIKAQIKHKLGSFKISEATLEFESEAEICLDPKHN